MNNRTFALNALGIDVSKASESKKDWIYLILQKTCLMLVDIQLNKTRTLKEQFSSFLHTDMAASEAIVKSFYPISSQQKVEEVQSLPTTEKTKTTKMQKKQFRKKHKHHSEAEESSSSEDRSSSSTKNSDSEEDLSKTSDNSSSSETTTKKSGGSLTLKKGSVHFFLFDIFL